MAVRTNYGTGIMPTLFGAELFMMDDDTDTLPTSIPLGGLATTNLADSLAPADQTRAARAVMAVLDRGIPGLQVGLGRKVFEMAEVYAELFAPYPKLQHYVHLYHPDMQGPMDIAELLWGSSLFVALVEVPDLVTALLELVTTPTSEFRTPGAPACPSKSELCGALVDASSWRELCCVTTPRMNLSPRMFDRFIKPYDGRLLATLGGGAVHFCGRGDHYIASVSEMDGLTTINMSQPEYNDMDAIFDHTVDKGINIIGLPRDAAEAALARGRDLRGAVHCC